MMDANAFLRRMLLVAAVSVLSMVNVAYAHGGGGKGTGGSSGGGSASSGSSSSGGHSASSTNGGHSGTASSHAVTTSGHTATVSKGSRRANDPVNLSQSSNATFQHVRVYRIFQQQPSTGYTTQYRETNNDDWRRKHQRLFLGFIRY
ncbi:MAG TPA: hypothetical protein VF020_23945 [Chthoniobacterales bacterium]